jgi:hypothetical protein
MKMDLISEELTKLIHSCQRDLGPTDQWFAPDGYPATLALCIIDSVFSINAGYEGVVNVVRRYRGLRTRQRGDADSDDVLELMGTFEHLGNPASRNAPAPMSTSVRGFIGTSPSR